MSRVIRLLRQQYPSSALIRTEWLILRAIFENQTNSYCSIDLIVRGSSASRGVARKRVQVLAAKGYLVDGNKGILQLSNRALSCEFIIVVHLRYTDGNWHETPDFDNKSNAQVSSMEVDHLGYKVPTEPREYETSLMAWIKENNG